MPGYPHESSAKEMPNICLGIGTGGNLPTK